MRGPVCVKRFFYRASCSLRGRPTGGGALLRFPQAPFPSSQLNSRNGRNLSRARGFCAACEPLTNSVRSGTSIPRERGPGVSGGLFPLAEDEAAPHARAPRAPSTRFVSSFAIPFPDWSSAVCLPRLVRHASIRTRSLAVATVPIGVLKIQGCCHLGIDLWRASRLSLDDPPRPRSHPNPALLHFRRILSFPQPLRGHWLTLLRQLGLFAVVERIVNLPRRPQPMQQYRQFSGHPH